MNIAIGSDHAGYAVKEKICSYLEENSHLIFDKGAFSDKSVDYPEFGHLVGNSVIVNFFLLCLDISLRHDDSPSLESIHDVI